MFACFEMVSDNQFYNAVRSYNYRMRLFNGVNDLEQKIFNYMNEKNLKKMLIPGYFIDISEDRIIITEMSLQNLNQLHLEFANITKENCTE